MAELLHTQKEVLKLLHKNGIATFKQGSFSEAVRIGRIPFRTERGVKNKLYSYNEVKKAIQKAGIGNFKGADKTTPSPDLSTTAKIDNLPDPTENQSATEYGESAVKELGGNPTITDANIYKTLYTGKLEKLKYEREKGLVISRQEVEDKAFQVARSIRDKILTTPERLANELASIDDPHVIKELLFSEFNKMLEGFSEDSFL